MRQRLLEGLELPEKLLVFGSRAARLCEAATDISNQRPDSYEVSSRESERHCCNWGVETLGKVERPQGFMKVGKPKLGADVRACTMFWYLVTKESSPSQILGRMKDKKASNDGMLTWEEVVDQAEGPNASAQPPPIGRTTQPWLEPKHREWESADQAQ